MTVEEKGKRFSHVYLSGDALQKDSKKARFRLSKLAERTFPDAKSDRHGHRSPDYNGRAQDAIENELGIRFASKSASGGYYPIWSWYFNRVTNVELLDTITVLSNELNNTFGKDASLFIAAAYHPSKFPDLI